MNIPSDETAPIDSKRLVAINSTTRFASLVASTLVAFFLTPFLINSLGTLLLGLKTLAYQALQFVGLASTAMGISYERYAKLNHARGDLEGMNSTLSAGLFVSVISALIFAVGSVVLAIYAGPLFSLPPDVLPSARWVFLLIGLSTAFLILTGVWETPAFVTERFYWIDLGQLLCSVVSAVLVVFAFKYSRPSIVVWVLLSNGSLVVWRALVMMPLARRLLPSFRVGWAKIKSSAQIREMMAFGGLNFIGGVGFLLYYTSDSILISHLPELGPDLIVNYNVAQRWDPQIRVLVMAFVGTLLPLMTAYVSRKETAAMQSTFLRGTRYSLLIGAAPAVLLIVYARPFLLHWVGEEFVRTSATVMQLILLQFILCIPERMAYNVNIAFGRMKAPVFVALGCGVLNIMLSVALVRWAGWGLLGIAGGTVVALLLISAYSIVHALRLMNVSIGRWLAAGCFRALFSIVPLALAGMGLQHVWVPRNLLDVFIQFALCGMVFAATAWCWSLTVPDRAELSGLLRRGMGRLPFWGGNE